MPSPISIIPRLRPLYRTLLTALCGALLCSLAAPVGAQAQEKPKLALLPVVVHSSENPAYVRQGLADMLRSRFDREGVFFVIALEDDKYATTRLSEAQKAARDAGAEFVLFGSFTRFGQGASVDMMCASTAAAEGQEQMRKIFVQSGSIGDVIPDLDELVGKVSRFAIVDYDERMAAAQAAAEAEPVIRPGGLADLRQRVEALEAAINRLAPNDSEPASQDAAAGSADASETVQAAEFARSKSAVR